MKITIQVLCKNSPNTTHEATVLVRKWGDWEIIESECSRKYGKTFAIISDCLKLTEIKEHNIISRICEQDTEKATEIILEGIEKMEPFEKHPLDNVWTRNDVENHLIRNGIKHLDKILHILSTKDFGHLAHIHKMLLRVLKKINQNHPNEQIAQLICQQTLEELQKRTPDESTIHSYCEILKEHPKYAIQLAKELYNLNRMNEAIKIIKDTNIITTEEGYKILKEIAQLGYYEAIGLINVFKKREEEK